MYRRLIGMAFALLLLASPGEARTIGGVEMEESLKSGNTAMILNGAGIRQKFFVGLYVAGLYLKEKSSDYKQIMAQDETMAIKIKIISKLITPELFKEACEEGFERTTNGNIKSMLT